MKPYSQDLRERVIARLKSGQQSQAAIAETFGVSQSIVEKWWRRWRETGQVAALVHAGGAPRVLSAYAAFIRAEVKQRPDIILEELGARLFESAGVQASPSMLCRELQRLKLPLKKSRFMTASAKRHA